MGITKINKDFFNRAAPIVSLYTVVWFQLKFTKNPFQSKEELSRVCQHKTSHLISQHQQSESVRLLCLQDLNLRHLRVLIILTIPSGVFQICTPGSGKQTRSFRELWEETVAGFWRPNEFK